LTWAWLHQVSDPAFAVTALIVALLAMRGCPTCWTLGLLETIADRHNRGESGPPRQVERPAHKHSKT
jgi:hypothetical protein